MSQGKSNFKTVLLTIIITTIVILGAGYYSQQHAVKTIQQEGKNENMLGYAKNQEGLSFKYPSSWSLYSTENDYDDGKSPKLFIEIWDINGMSTTCGDRGGCQQDEKKLQQDIEKGTAPEIMDFQGGKGSFKVTFSCNENPKGLIPSPTYKFAFYKENKAYLITLNDRSHQLTLNGSGVCNSSNDSNKIQFQKELNDSSYQAYNDFISLIKNTLVLK